jgi:hypothetical protein
MLVRFHTGRLYPKFPGHAQVDDQRFPAIEAKEQIFAAPPKGIQATVADQLAKESGVGLRYNARPKDLGIDNAFALQLGR